MKVSVVSLGCKVNQSEGEEILNRFTASGFKQAGPAEPADIMIINTCTVTGEADRKSRKSIYQAVKRKTGNATIVAVTGCYAETNADSLIAIPGVDLVVPQSEKDGLAREVASLAQSRRLAMTESHDSEEVASNATRSRNDGISRHRAYLKIQDGCDNRCAYCIVPDARGKPRSLPEDEILTNAAGLAAEGVKEIVLTGINVGKHENLAGLIRELQKTSGLARLRLSSIEPEDVVGVCADTVYAQIRESNQAYLCPHWHIPLQSGDDETLKRMGRRYTAAEYLDIIARVRDAYPDVAITTDVIVGFPGETDGEFRNTFRFIEKAVFARLHVFRYSKRTGTPAAVMEGQVPAAIKAERSEALRELSGRLEAGYRNKFIGRELDVLVEKASGNRLTGTSDNYLTVSFEGEPNLVGKIVKIRLDE